MYTHLIHTNINIVIKYTSISLNTLLKTISFVLVLMHRIHSSFKSLIWQSILQSNFINRRYKNKNSARIRNLETFHFPWNILRATLPFPYRKFALDLSIDNNNRVRNNPTYEFVKASIFGWHNNIAHALHLFVVHAYIYIRMPYICMRS